MKPYAESCDQNKDAILAILVKEFASCRDILEIGSGTGQHAVYFSAQLHHLVWQTSDTPDTHAGIQMWLDEAALDNVLAPIELDVRHGPWPEKSYDGVFSANTSHIMSWAAVQQMIAGIGVVLRPGGVFCLYGPFNYQGAYTSASNARFDAWLRERDPESAIRDAGELNEQASQHGLIARRDHEMPANNRILVWEKC